MENQEKIFKTVNIVNYVYELIKNGAKVKTFIKKAVVNVRPAIVGEEVITYIKDKNTNALIEETRQIVKEENMVIITNPGGENYLVKKDIVENNYVKGEKEGEYIAKAKPRKVIEIDENISFTAPWGETMNLQAGAWLNIDNMDKIYGINPEEFYETHIPFVENEVEKNL